MNRMIVPWGSALLAIAIALAAGYRWGQSQHAQPNIAAGGPGPVRKVLYWYDPMRPDQHFDKPGLSPMGMQMVPRYAAEPEASGIAVAPGLQQALGIRTVPVRRGHLETTIRVPGTIAWDLREERVVSLPVDAIVRRLDARTPFERVHAGQPLARVLAPSWSTALAEARALGDARSSGGRGLAAAA
ncbi:MAG TPA: efflux RND transporter periplasmic adaptor subunit, partial [Xanthomonadaceae bacterium]|nr:efflux RND transporter periplasmic adaptor subunit [Xanthomonadaceae bacterium]